MRHSVRSILNHENKDSTKELCHVFVTTITRWVGVLFFFTFYLQRMGGFPHPVSRPGGQPIGQPIWFSRGAGVLDGACIPLIYGLYMELCRYVYIYIHIYIYVLYIYICVYIYINIICKRYVHMYTYIHIYIYTHVCVFYMDYTWLCGL